MSEIVERFFKEKIEAIVRRGESFQEMYLYCPYCGEKHSDDIWEDFDLEPSGEEKEGQCRSCERHFFYSVDLSFSSRKAK